MKKHFFKMAMLLVATLLIGSTGLVACTATPELMSAVTITLPSDGAELEEGNVTVSVNVTDFDIVDKLGEPAVAGEGHIHYYMDAEPPTTAGEPAVTGAGTYAATMEISHTWTGVTAGTHTFAVQLVNNDHTPLDTPVTAEVTVTIVAAATQEEQTPIPITEEESRQIAEDFARNSATFAFDGMEDSLELILTDEGDSPSSWIFTYTFESSSAGYGDRTGEVVAQVITPHEAVITVEDGEVTGAIMDDVWDMMAQEMLSAAAEVSIAAVVSGDEIEVTATVSNFELVDKLGENVTQGEGHLHFYLDTLIPTTPGQPAVSAPGTYAVSSNTSYTWTAVTSGNHTIGVQLVNNDHTPLDPPVTDTAEVTVEENLYSLVSGWYRGEEITYYDFGANTTLANGNIATAPIYVLITGMDAEGNPQLVEGQHNIIDLVPGDTGYSDLWQVNLVTVPEDYEADSLRSVNELMAQDYPVTPTDTLVNCPIVPANSVLETGMELTQGWYRGMPVYYYDFGPNPDTPAPIYVPITGMDAEGNPQLVEGQGNIIDVIPGDEGYSAFWQVNLVSVPQDYVADTLKSAAEVMASGYEMTETDILVNCPVVTPEEEEEGSSEGTGTTIDLTAQNIAFNLSTITVPAGAEVTINFSNQDNLPHNFAVYRTSAAQDEIFSGQIITGGTITYQFTAPSMPGTYFFWCDVHTSAMTGDFIVE